MIKRKQNQSHFYGYIVLLIYCFELNKELKSIQIQFGSQIVKQSRFRSLATITRHLAGNQKKVKTWLDCECILCKRLKGWYYCILTNCNTKIFWYVIFQQPITVRLKLIYQNVYKTSLAFKGYFKIKVMVLRFEQSNVAF